MPQDVTLPWLRGGSGRMARAGKIGLAIGMIAVWLADRLYAPELHAERQVRRIQQAAAGGIGARLAWAELSAISHFFWRVGEFSLKIRLICL